MLVLGCTSYPDLPPDPERPARIRPAGQPCSTGESCEVMLCVELTGAGRRCTNQCAADVDCPAAWACQPSAEAGADVCQCAVSGAEVCDGADNDCNGYVDDDASECPFLSVCMEGACTSTCPPPDGFGHSARYPGPCTTEFRLRQNDGGCTPSATKTHSYDANGRLIRSETAERYEAWEYDDAGNLTSSEFGDIESGAEGRVDYHSYEQDSEGRITRRCYTAYCSVCVFPEQACEDYEYDDAGRRVTARLDTNLADQDEVTTYGYDERGYLAWKSIDRGADGAIDVYTTYTVDDFGNTIAEEHYSEMGGAWEGRIVTDFDEFGNALATYDYDQHMGLSRRQDFGYECW